LAIPAAGKLTFTLVFRGKEIEANPFISVFTDQGPLVPSHSESLNGNEYG
jgi:hypothetical protein